MQLLPKQKDVFGRIIGITEVCQKKPRRLALQDRGKGSIPDPKIDVRRRSRRHGKGISLDAYAGSITNERDVFHLVEIADVVRRVPWRVDDLHLT